MNDVTNSTCGMVGIVGRPNVGKSTLLNQILGEKISITSSKPQTTRHRILGIKTIGDAQTIYVDTPGLHSEERHALNSYMNRTVHQTISDIDLALFVVDREGWRVEDEMVLNKIQKAKIPAVLVINKIDKVKAKEDLLPLIQSLSARHAFVAIIPISAKTGDGLELLYKQVGELLPPGPHLFPDDQITDRSDRFLAAELVREKLMRRLGDELPYALTVAIEEFKDTPTLLRISALILVERPSQKIIVIGNKGEQLKVIGTQARHDMEKLFGKKILLKLWVIVKEGWSDDKHALHSLGYD